MSSNRRRTLLDNYIESGGSDLPLDFEEFMSGNIYQFDCVFCKEEHDNHPVYKLDNYGKITASLGIFSCNQCNTHVAAMRFRLYGTVETEEERNTSEGSRPATRLNSVLTLTFPDDVYKYYEHLNPHRDLFCENKAGGCIVCEQNTVSQDITYFMVRVPVMPEVELTGGNIFICSHCLPDTGVLNLVYQRALASTEIFRENCRKCDTHYYISKNEFEYRQTHSPLGIEPEWLCPSCSYNQIDGLPDTSLFYNPENAPNRYNPIKRFTELGCCCCDIETLYDLQMDVEHLEMRYKISPTTVICESCAASGAKAFITNRYTIKLAEGLYLKMVFSIYWDYELVRFKKGVPGMQLILTGKTDEEAVTDAVAVAFEQISQLKGSGTWKEI